MASTPGFLLLPPSYSFQELSAFPREAGGSGAGLHPVVYPCTGLLLLCLFSTIITYILNHRWGPLWRGGRGGKAVGLPEYWPRVPFPSGPTCRSQACLAFYWKALGLENTLWGLSPPCPGASLTFTHMHVHRYLPSPLALPMALRPHGPDLGWVAH